MRRIAVIAMVQRAVDRRFLMAYHNAARGIQFCGGKLENEDRSVVSGAQRELLEETGLKVPLKFLGYRDDEPGWLCLVFHGLWVNAQEHGELQHCEPDKGGPWEWLTMAEAKQRGEVTNGAWTTHNLFYDPIAGLPKASQVPQYA